MTRKLWSTQRIRRWWAALAVVAGLVAVNVPAVAAQTPPETNRVTKPPTTVPTTAPPGAPEGVPGAPDIKINAEWLQLQSGDGTSQLVAVLRPPKGKGPFPAIISFHGGSGLLSGVIEQGARLADAGFVVVAGCWSPSRTFGSSPLWCPNPPEAGTAIANLEAFTRAQPGVRKNRIGVLGLSAGGGAVFNYPWGRSVRARASDSGPARGPTGEFSTPKGAPVLLLFGTADPGYVDGTAKAFETALRANGVSVDAEYYEGANHVVTANVLPPDVRAPANARLIKFLNKRLR